MTTDKLWSMQEVFYDSVLKDKYCKADEATVDAAVAAAKRYLAYFQGTTSGAFECADQTTLRHALPERRRRALDERGAQARGPRHADLALDDLGLARPQQDVAHDAYLRIYPREDKSQPEPVQPEAVLYTTARRLAINRLKRRSIFLHDRSLQLITVHVRKHDDCRAWPHTIYRDQLLK